MKKRLFHRDSVQLEEGSKLALFVNGVQEPITPEQAYSEFMAGEGDGAAAARQRMIDRSSRPHSESSTEARENMIRRGGGRSGAAR